MTGTLIVVSCLLLGCGDEAAQITQERPRHSAGFALSIPPEWTTQENQLGLALIAVAPLDDPADTFAENVNVNMLDNPTGLSLEDFHTQQFDATALRSVLNDFEPGEVSTATIGSLPAKRATYRHRMGETHIRALTYTIVTDSRAYVLTCSATTDRFDAYLPTFDWICSSFLP